MKLILFCDYGLDDAAATVDALLHAEQDGYESVDLVAIGGNVPAEVALRNAGKLIAHLNFHLPRVTLVDTRELPQPCEFLKEIHGGDGMGDLFEDCSCPVPVLPFSDWLSTLKEGEFILLSLGPMTLLPPVLKKRPKKFLFMGGNIAETPNYLGYEFNHGVNRDAFRECVRSPHVAVTMDTCRHPLLNIQRREIVGEDLLSKIVRRSQQMSIHSGEKGCYLWDDIAVKFLRHPDWFALSELKDRDGNILNVAKYIHEKTFSEILFL